MWPSMTTSHGQRLTCPSGKGSGSRLSTTRECPGADPVRDHSGGSGSLLRARSRRQRAMQSSHLPHPPAPGSTVVLPSRPRGPLRPGSPLAPSSPLSFFSLLLSRWPLGGRWMSGVYHAVGGRAMGGALLGLWDRSLHVLLLPSVPVCGLWLPPLSPTASLPSLSCIPRQFVRSPAELGAPSPVAPPPTYQWESEC